MLPKQEKTKKTSSFQQLNLVDTISDEKKLRHKRIFIIITLILTVGCSLIFWVYRSSKTFFTTYKISNINFNFHLPVFNIPIKQPNLDKIINQALVNNQNTWSIFIQVTPSFSWSKNSQNLFIDNTPDASILELSQKPFSTNNPIFNNIPDGAQIQENILSQPDSYQLNTLITVPQKQIFIAIKIVGNSKLDESIKLIPTLVEKIYWELI